MSTRRKILVADDEAGMVEVIRETLVGKDFDVLTAADGEECFKKAMDSVPDLIILDIKMPVSDGFEALRKIRAYESTREIPVIMLTARSDTQSIFDSQKMGSTDYLIKPVSLQELIKYVNRYI